MTEPQTPQPMAAPDCHLLSEPHVWSILLTSDLPMPLTSCMVCGRYDRADVEASLVDRGWTPPGGSSTLQSATIALLAGARDRALADAVQARSVRDDAWRETETQRLRAEKAEQALAALVLPHAFPTASQPAGHDHDASGCGDCDSQPGECCEHCKGWPARG